MKKKSKNTKNKRKEWYQEWNEQFKADEGELQEFSTMDSDDVDHILQEDAFAFARTGTMLIYMGAKNQTFMAWVNKTLREKAKAAGHPLTKKANFLERTQKFLDKAAPEIYINAHNIAKVIPLVTRNQFFDKLEKSIGQRLVEEARECDSLIEYMKLYAGQFFDWQVSGFIAAYALAHRNEWGRLNMDWFNFGFDFLNNPPEDKIEVLSKFVICDYERRMAGKKFQKDRQRLTGLLGQISDKIYQIYQKTNFDIAYMARISIRENWDFLTELTRIMADEGVLTEDFADVKISKQEIRDIINDKLREIVVKTLIERRTEELKESNCKDISKALSREMDRLKESKSLCDAFDEYVRSLIRDYDDKIKDILENNPVPFKKSLAKSVKNRMASKLLMQGNDILKQTKETSPLDYINRAFELHPEQCDQYCDDSPLFEPAKIPSEFEDDIFEGGIAYIDKGEEEFQNIMDGFMVKANKEIIVHVALLKLNRMCSNRQESAIRSLNDLHMLREKEDQQEEIKFLNKELESARTLAKAKQERLNDMQLRFNKLEAKAAELEEQNRILAWANDTDDSAANIFDNVEPDGDPEIDDTDYPKGTILIGGHPRWQKFFKKHHPGIRTYDGNNASFNADSITSSTPLVLLNVTHMCHPAYWKLRNRLKETGAKWQYIYPRYRGSKTTSAVDK